MFHPFQLIPSEQYLFVFLPFFGIFIILSILLATIPLKPNILEFEFNAGGVIKQWKETDKILAAFSLGLDYLYLVIYSTTASLACIWAYQKLENHGFLFASVGILLAWGQWLAALLDAIENTFLLRILLGYETKISSLIAKWCAIAKFLLITLGLLYVAIAGIVWIIGLI